MTTVAFDLLGPPDLRVDGSSVSVDTRKAYAVLARVLVEGPQRRDALDALLWPTSEGHRARAALRRTLAALRKVLPPDALEEGDDVALAISVATDLDEVGRLVGDGRATRDPSALAAADQLHRGDFLAGLHFRDADPFEHWRRDTAQRLTRRRMRLLERWCRVLVERHELGRAVEVTQRRLALDPLHEPSHQQLMLLHAWQGDRAAASRQYAACVRVLDDELGVAPLPRTVALDRAVRAGTVEPPPPRTGPPPATRSTGRGGTTVPADGGRWDAASTGTTEPHAPTTVARPTPATLPMAGRAAEVALLLRTYREVGDDGVVVTVTGEAGIGKTRLVTEVAAMVAGPVVRLTPRDDEASFAYAPVTTALRSLGPRLSRLAEPLRGELARLVPAEAGVAPPTEPLSSPAARTRFVDACATALTAPLESTSGPGLLVVDDLDRADPETRELVGYLARRLTGRSLLLVVTARDGRGLPAGDRRLALSRLAPGDVAELAAAGGVGDESDRLHEESEGVPLLVVSYLAARASGITGWSLPADGRLLVGRRVGQLDEVARQVLTAAAVLGDRTTAAVLERVSGRDDEELVDAVEALVGGQLLEVTDDGGLAFTHRKVREVVLAETSQVRRRLMHRRCADALAASSPPVAAATLARHLEAAGRQDEAAAAHAAAGRRAAELYANAEAIDHLEAAVALGHDDRAALLLLLGDLHTRTGRYSDAGQRYVRAAAHGASVPVVEHRLGALAARRGRLDEAAQHLALALDAGVVDDDLHVHLLADLAQVLAVRGELDEAADRAADGVDRAARDGVTAGAVARARNTAGLVARRRGELAGARAHLRASLEVAPGPDQRAAALNNLALVLGDTGALDEALALSEEALAVGRTSADRHREAALLNNLADLLHAAGRTSEALELQAQAAERFAGVGAEPTTTPEIWRLVDW